MKTLQKQIKRFASPLLFAIVTFLAYGLFIAQQGFYWDDWAYAWTRAHLGVEGIFAQISVNRPLRAYWEALLTPLLGSKPLAWQIFALFSRWLSALALWYLLQTLRNEEKAQNTLIVLFFLVYPGFSQTPLAVIYPYFWVLLSLYFLSLSLMIQAARDPRKRKLKIGIALLLSALNLFGLEYLFGLELARPFFLWMALKDRPKRFQKTALFYLPYFVFTLIYLLWRIFFYQSAIYAVGDAISLSGIWTQLWQTIPLVSIGAWTRVFAQPFSPESGLSPRLALVMGTILLFGTLFFASYLKSLNTREAEASTQKYDWDLLLLSLALILAAGIPFYAAAFPVKLSFPEDRFTFPFILGVSMLLAWLLSLIKNEMQRFTLAALLISLAITTQIYNSDIYRREWRLQRLFAQQLFWRAPDIEKGTLILAEDAGFFPHNDDEAFAFLLNWAYDPAQSKTELDYEYFYLSARLGGDLPALKAGEPIFKDHLSATFTGNTDQVLLLHFSPPSCLRILDPVYDQDVSIAPRDVDNLQTGTLTLPRVLAPALSLSNPRELISKNNTDFNPPIWLFGTEPERTWCYYFEKADLARQYGNWEKVAKLGDQAFAVPYTPADAAEYLPFIEAYARLGRVGDAGNLSETMLDKNPLLQPMLCALWQRLVEEGALEIAEIPHCPPLR